CPTRSRRWKTSPRARPRSTSSSVSSTTALPNCARRNATIFPAGSRKYRSMRPTPACARRSARSRSSARSACRSTPTSPASRSTGPKYLPFEKKRKERGKPIWLHPARGANMPDYIDEKKSLYEIWWTFGWSYETATAMARLLFSKIMDNHPNLKIITHHFGGIVPMLEGRIGPGWDVLGSRTSDEVSVALRKSLQKRPLDYCKQHFYADTAVFGGKPATKCGLEFFPLEKIIFASDCPFDPEGGTMYPRVTLQILDSLDIPKADREKINYKNLEAVTGATLVK